MNSLILIARTLCSQQTESPVASSHMQMDLTAPSGARKWFSPGLLVEVILLPLTHQHVCQPLAAYDLHLSFGTAPNPSS